MICMNNGVWNEKYFSRLIWLLVGLESAIKIGDR